MIIKEIDIEEFRAIRNQHYSIGKRLTAIAGRNGTMKSTLLGMLGQPFSIPDSNPLAGERTIEGYNFRSQFQEKFCLSKEFDHIGSHTWTLKLWNMYYFNGKTEYKVKSAARKQAGHPDSIRFVNAAGKIKGMGYIQLPVIYLSLSRLFPIGESGKTKTLASEFSEEEQNLYVKWYKRVLSIQSLKNPKVGLEKKDLKRIFTGVGDDSHDVTTCSAGEGNVGRILTSILSFRRLKVRHGKDYKGGILLIDELDATLYGFSQKTLVKFLNDISSEFNIQIIFTTHSPLILKEVSNLQRDEIRKKKIDVDKIPYDYDNEIIYLTPKYTDAGERLIEGENIHSAVALKKIINDINLLPTTIGQCINVYNEDLRAADFMKCIFKESGISIERYVNFVGVNLGWTNYLHLHQKAVPEFLNSLIVLDHDVMGKMGHDQKAYIADKTENVLFMPEDVEAGMFSFLKNHDAYNNFEKMINAEGISCSYDVCFRDWPETSYKTEEYKKWFNTLESSVGGTEKIFKTWIDANLEVVGEFVDSFVLAYNKLAERLELDYIICK